MTLDQIVTAGGFVLALAIAVGGLALWALRATIDPLKESIKDLSVSIKEFGGDLKDHAQQLADQDKRLAIVEKTHEEEDRIADLGRARRAIG